MPGKRPVSRLLWGSGAFLFSEEANAERFGARFRFQLPKGWPGYVETLLGGKGRGGNNKCVNIQNDLVNANSPVPWVLPHLVGWGAICFCCCKVEAVRENGGQRRVWWGSFDPFPGLWLPQRTDDAHAGTENGTGPGMYVRGRYLLFQPRSVYVSEPKRGKRRAI